MAQILPKVIPINELKNTAKISQLCRESDVPIVITRNGYGEMVLMSVALYERTMAETISPPAGHAGDPRASGNPPAAPPAPAGELAPRPAAGASEPSEDEITLLSEIFGD